MSDLNPKCLISQILKFQTGREPQYVGPRSSCVAVPSTTRRFKQGVSPSMSDPDSTGTSDFVSRFKQGVSPSMSDLE